MAERALDEDDRHGDDAGPHPAEHEVIGLRAELEGAQTQLSMARRELESYEAQEEQAQDLRGDLDTINVEAIRARESAENAQAELQLRSAGAGGPAQRVAGAAHRRAASGDARRRAARAKAELQSVGASHRADLVEREAELEEKVRAMREEFQAELTRMEAQYREQMAQRELAAVRTRLQCRGCGFATAGYRRAGVGRASQAVRTGRGRYRQGHRRGPAPGRRAHHRSGRAGDHGRPAAGRDRTRAQALSERLGRGGGQLPSSPWRPRNGSPPT